MSEVQTKQPARIGYYDRLRVLAMTAVVLIHVCGSAATSLAAAGQPLQAGWHLANLLDAASRFAVPLFLMLTGALLLGSDQALSLRQLLSRRLPRVLVPLAFWTIVYWLFKWLTAADFSPADAILHFFQRPAEIHLWYLYALTAIYLLLPVLRLITRHAGRRMVGYLLLLWFVFSSLWRAAAGLFPALALQDYANLDILGGYAGYVLLGWYLASSPKLPNRTVCIALTAAGIAATTLLTWLMTRRSGELNAVFYQYFMPNVLITAVGVFGLFRRTGSRPASRTVTALSSLSFGVYLCHMLFFRLLEPAFAALPLPAAVTMLLLTAAVWLLSVLFSILLRQIPVVRFITLGERFRS